MIFSFCAIGQKVYNVKHYGAKGDGKTNDWEAIQYTIDKALSNGGGTVYLPVGNYVIHDRTLLIWGLNLKVTGEDKAVTTLIRTGRPGWWGELLSISGKSNGGKYYGGFGKISYQRFDIYKGKSSPAQNIEISNLTLSSKVPYPNSSNNLAITNGRNIQIRNCIIENAPKSNVAIVNVTTKAKNENVLISNSVLRNSGTHNLRVISYNQGRFLGNSVKIEKTQFYNVKNEDQGKEINNEKVHLWYRAALGSPNISLRVIDCYFDNTGKIVGTVNVDNLEILNSKIESSIDLRPNARYTKNARIQIIGNHLSEAVKTKNMNKRGIERNNIAK